MKIFRRQYFVSVLSALTGIVFLNMSFFTTEIATLKIQDQQLLKNIAELLSNCASEEESDGETSSSKDNFKEVDILIGQILSHHTSLIQIGNKLSQDLVDHYAHANHSQTFSPPPDLFYFC
jgi:hypothetical protein